VVSPATDSGGGAGEAPALELRGIDKRFGPVHANRSIALAIRRGSVHGLIGENGAGKSTLMNIVYGFHRADAGEILVGGRRVEIHAPQGAIAAGIGMVHQHFMLVENFTVLENVVLGVEQGARLAGSLAHARTELEKLARDYALDVPLDAAVADLPVGVQQRVEILKALYRGARILILDEPTAVLTPQEAAALFRLLARLRDEGKSVVLVTHKLREIMAATDRVTVMRQGAIVGELATRDTSARELAEKWSVAPSCYGWTSSRPGRARCCSRCAISRCGTVSVSPGSRASASTCGRARSWASPAFPATGRASCSRRSRARAPGGGTHPAAGP
jgi:simple sugar transport system ATP-binding protein